MKQLVPLLIVTFLVTGFAYYTLFSGPDIDDITIIERESLPEQTAAEPAEPVRESFAGEGSLYSLLTRGDSLECAITYIPNPVESELYGNVFTHDGNLRGDFVVPTPDFNGEMVTSIIIAEGTIWQWTEIDGDTVGSRQAAAFDTATLDRLVAPIGFATEVQYTCLTWPQVDSTIFEAPTTVLFTDPTTATFEEGVIFEE